MSLRKGIGFCQQSDRISVAETYFINPKIVDVSAIYYAKNDIIIEGLWRISQWL